jgi:hypothetical protein
MVNNPWNRIIVSVGTSPENTTHSLTAILNITKVKLGSDNYAIKANGVIDVNGTANFVTIPLDQKSANLSSNGMIDYGRKQCC